MLLPCLLPDRLAHPEDILPVCKKKRHGSSRSAARCLRCTVVFGCQACCMVGRPETHSHLQRPGLLRCTLLRGTLVLPLQGPTRPGEDIRATGSDIKPGELVLAAGSLIAPAELGLRATVGAARMQVRPSWAVMVCPCCK